MKINLFIYLFEQTILYTLGFQRIYNNFSLERKELKNKNKIQQKLMNKINYKLSLIIYRAFLRFSTRLLLLFCNLIYLMKKKKIKRRPCDKIKITETLKKKPTY